MLLRPDDAADAAIERAQAAAACDALRSTRARARGASAASTPAPDAVLEDALDVVAAAHSFTARQADALLRYLPVADDGFPAPEPPENDDSDWARQRDVCSGRRAALCAALLGKVRGPVDRAALLRPLCPPERASVIHRLGWSNVWTPLRPDGCYVLDLSKDEDRGVARCLVHLEAAESGSTLSGLKGVDLDHPDDWLPELGRVAADCHWRRGLPTGGLWTVQFCSPSDDVRDFNVGLRAAMAALATATPPNRFADIGDAASLYGTRAHNRETLTPLDFVQQSRYKMMGSCRLPDPIYAWETVLT